MPERDMLSLGVMGMGAGGLRKFFRRRRRRRRPGEGEGGGGRGRDFNAIRYTGVILGTYVKSNGTYVKTMEPT